MPKKTDLVDGVVERLRKVDRPASAIAAEAEVPESWLRMFMRGKIANPGVRPFQRVVEYLDRTTA